MHERNVPMHTALRIGEQIRLAVLHGDDAALTLSLHAPAAWPVDAGGIASTPRLRLHSGDWHLLCVRPGQRFWIGAVEVRIACAGAAGAGLRLGVSGAPWVRTELEYQLSRQTATDAQATGSADAPGLTMSWLVH